eukprot:9611814-Heterocapsa_arctica.AAC.1
MAAAQQLGTTLRFSIATVGDFIKASSPSGLGFARDRKSNPRGLELVENQKRRNQHRKRFRRIEGFRVRVSGARE